MNYAAMAAKARRILAAKGTTVTIRRIVAGTYDPTTGSVAGGSTLTQTTPAVILPASVNRDEAFAQQAMVRSKRRRLLLGVPDPLVFDPMPGDEVQFEGRWWTIPGLSPLRPDGGTTILYEGEVE
jgi:hypothetical protein